ncbi:MAG: SOS response-associated peptidase [Acidimicrobiaceae bacterium]|nr:SOS response-associated peptidase [Acidimicrobiaceae bacterium]
MCGRIALYSPPIRFTRLLDATLAAGLDDETRPSWNVGPQRRLFGVAEHEGARVLDRYRWGLLPSWAKDPSVSNRLFNARGETVAEKSSFRAAFKKRPCVIPVDGFYEWDHRPGRAKQPNFFTRRDHEPLLLAGLYEHWRDPAGPEDAPWVQTCTVITTTPNEDMNEIHDRMPVILELANVAEWLDPGESGPAQRAHLLRPAPTGTLQYYGVGAAVGSVRNDGPELIEPAEPQTLF